MTQTESAHEPVNVRVATAEPAPAHRAPGRPRSVEADRAIIDALARVRRGGFDQVWPMEAVAAGLASGRPRCTRRYPGKAELVIRAASCLSAARPRG